MELSSEILDTPYLRGPDVQSSIAFPDPFLDMASFVMPRSLRNVLDMCEGIWLKNGTYRMALSRIVRYFLTRVEFEGIDSDKEEELRAFFYDKFRVIDQLALIGDDFLAYGNSFTSIILPFRRYLVCRTSRYMAPINKLRWSFKEYKFYAYCPACHKEHEFLRMDLRSSEQDRIVVKRWAPQELKIRHHPIAQCSEYYWSIPRNIIAEVERGNTFYVEYMPWEIIEAIRQKKLFKFYPNVMYHMRENALAGINLNGWGVSRLLSSFAQAWYVQILKRANETLALDYTIPFRVITPAAAPGRDPLLSINLGDFTSRVLAMIRDHRQDPAAWHALPFPLQYQILGAENKALATPELISNGLTELLNSLGIPAELYQGTLQFQAWPAALRLFQQTWPHLVANFNGWLRWATDIICTELNLDTPARIYLQPVSLADDIDQRQLMMQLASANIISKRTALAPYGIQVDEEVDRIMKEQKNMERKMREYQEDRAASDAGNQAIQAAAMSGISPQQLAAPQGVPVSPAAAIGTTSTQQEVTPGDKLEQAQDIALQLAQMPYSQRKSQMLQLKQSDQVLHALVKAKLEELRTQAEAQGRAQLSGGM